MFSKNGSAEGFELKAMAVCRVDELVHERCRHFKKKKLYVYIFLSDALMLLHFFKQLWQPQDSLLSCSVMSCNFPVS